MREMHKRNYLAAAVITFLLFGMGLLLGIFLSGERLDYSKQQLQQQRLELDSLQMQYQFINSFNLKGNCAAIDKTFEVNVKNLIDLGSKIEKYSADVNFNVEEFNNLKREYALAQLRYWLLARKAEETCNRDIVSVIYFYSDEDACFSCSTQSRILTHMKGKLENKLLVFSMDAAFTIEPMVTILKESYNITEFPSLVIGDDLFTGLQTEEQLLKEFCLRFLEKPELCQP